MLRLAASTRRTWGQCRALLRVLSMLSFAFTPRGLCFLQMLFGVFEVQGEAKSGLKSNHYCSSACVVLKIAFMVVIAMVLPYAWVMKGL